MLIKNICALVEAQVTKTQVNSWLTVLDSTQSNTIRSKHNQAKTCIVVVVVRRGRRGVWCVVVCGGGGCGGGVWWGCGGGWWGVWWVCGGGGGGGGGVCGGGGGGRVCGCVGVCVWGWVGVCGGDIIFLSVCLSLSLSFCIPSHSTPVSLYSHGSGLSS